MASVKEMTAKDGSVFYRVEVSQGKHKGRVVRRFYPDASWTPTYAQRQLQQYVAKLETEVHEGLTLNKADQAAADDKAEADRKKAEEAAALEQARIKTVQQYGDQVFMAGHIEITASNNTIVSYRSTLRTMIYPVIGDMKITEVTPAQLKALLADYQRDHAHASVVKLYTVLSGLFKSAFLDDTLVINPMLKVQRPKPKKSEVKQTSAEAYTADEARHILECVKEEPLQWQLYINLLAETGLRRAEASGLMWDCVDLEEKTITVKRTYNYTSKTGAYWDTPKSRQERVLPIGEELCDLFERQRQELKVMLKAKAKAQPGKVSALPQYVFVGTVTKTHSMDPELPMHPQSPTRYFRNFEKKYGVDHFHPHKLRHTMASVAITNGVDVATVSELLGHADPALTLRVYTSSNEEAKRKGASVLRGILRAAGNE